jgi:hypothetical protein
MAYNPDSHLSYYKPDDQDCVICKKAVEPQHTKFRDTITGQIVHDYCFRTEPVDHFRNRQREAIASGSAVVHGPLRWA